VATYLVDFFQYQRINPSALVFDVHLVELVPVRGDGADFPDGELVASPHWGLSERVVWDNVDQLAVSTKAR
jgi:hypothetical protein